MLFLEMQYVTCLLSGALPVLSSLYRVVRAHIHVRVISFQFHRYQQHCRLQNNENDQMDFIMNTFAPLLPTSADEVE